MSNFTQESVLALSPDESSTKAAKGLLNLANWQTLGSNEQAVWGECKGSGSKPYQVQVDVSGPTFKCSCPSRKFPCKHGLALLLIKVNKDSAFASKDAPEWVAKWLQDRQNRAEKKIEKQAAVATSAAETPSEEIAAKNDKRDKTRRKTMNQGIDELQLWLSDQVDNGLSQLAGKPKVWKDLSARMVDAKCAGLAPRLDKISQMVNQGSNWHLRVLAELGQLQLMCDAWQHLDDLPSGAQADLKTALGWSIEKDEVLYLLNTNKENTIKQIDDIWEVLGQSTKEEDRIWRRRVWLYGQQSGQIALLLNYSHGSAKFETSILVGSRFRASLVFYPSNVLMRAFIQGEHQLIDDNKEIDQKDNQSINQLNNKINNQSIHPFKTQTQTEAFAQVGRFAAQNPWNRILPMIFFDSTLLYIPKDKRPFQLDSETPETDWFIYSDSGHILPIELNEEKGWLLLAQTGGHKTPLFGEWNGEQFSLLTVWHENGVFHVGA